MSPIVLNPLFSLILIASCGAVVGGLASGLRSYAETRVHLPPQYRDYQSAHVAPDVWVFSPWVPRSVQIRYQRRRVFQLMMSGLAAAGFAAVFIGSGRYDGAAVFGLGSLLSVLFAATAQRTLGRHKANRPSRG